MKKVLSIILIALGIPAFSQNLGRLKVVVIDTSTGNMMPGPFLNNILGGSKGANINTNRVINDLQSLDSVAVKSSQLSIPFGTDQTTFLQKLANSSKVRTIYIDKDDVITNGTVDFKGKKIIFQNGAKITGTGTITNFVVEADHYKQCFGTSLKVTKVQNTDISIGWFGLKADDNYDTGGDARATDNYTSIVKAISSINIKANLHLVGLCGERNFMYVSQTLTIPSIVGKFYGDGDAISILKFPPNKTGIILRGADLYDLQVRACDYIPGPTGFNNDTAIGIWVKSPNAVERCGVVGFAGDGYFINGNVPESNASQAAITSSYAVYNGRYGFHSQGGDANVIRVIRCSAVGNAIWGFNIEGFLGCDDISNNHAANNCYDNRLNQSIAVHYNPSAGKNYWYRCLQNNKGVEPEVSKNWQQYWEREDNVLPYYNPTWESTKQYLIGGDYRFDGANANSVYASNYHEGSGLVRNYGRGIILGGNIAYGKGSIHNDFGYISSSSFRTDWGEGNVRAYLDGNKLGFMDGSGGWEFGFRYRGDHIALVLSNLDAENVKFFNGWTNPAIFGRTSINPSGELAVDRIMIDANYAGQYRALSFRNAAPWDISKMAISDISLNSAMATVRGLGWYKGGDGQPYRIESNLSDIKTNAVEVTDPNGLIIKSSTPGSTKRFLITVNDAGQIKATDVSKLN